MFLQLLQDWKGKAAGERIDVPEPFAGVLVEGKVAQACEDPTPALVARAMEQLAGKFTQGVERVVDAALKHFADAQAQAQRHAVGAIFGAGQSGDPRHSFGDWLLAVGRGDAKYLAEHYDSHLSYESKAALNTGTGGQGGYLVPTEFVPNLLMAAAEQSVVRSKATVIPMTSRSVQIPALDLASDPASGDTQFLGGLTASWTEEASALVQKDPSFKQVEIVAYELSGYSVVSNTLMADSAVGLEALLTRLFGGAIAWYEDHAFLRGNGVGKPLGMMESAAAIAVTRNTANDFKLVDAARMLGRLLPGWSSKATCWVMSPSVVEKVIQMSDSSSRAVWIPNAREALPMTLFGLPIAISEKMKQLGAAKDVLLADMRHYLIGDRQQIEIAFSEHFKFSNNQGAWRFVSRVGGQPWLRGPANLAEQSDTVSPFVYLQ